MATSTFTLSVRYTDLGIQNGRRGLILHLTHPASHAALTALAKNDTERDLLALPGTDIRLSASDSGTTAAAVIAKILRRDSYFLAVLVARAGRPKAVRCEHRCRARNFPFDQCLFVAGQQQNACANCIWDSYAARC